MAIHSKYFFPIICRFFQSTAYYWGREQSPSTPKCAPSHAGTCSRIEYHRVRKTLVEQLLRGFLLFKTSKMVTFGHHFEKWGPKNASKAVQKNLQKFAFGGRQTKNNLIIFLLHRRLFSDHLSIILLFNANCVYLDTLLFQTLLAPN